MAGITVGTALAVSAAGAVASGVIQASATKKAAQAQTDALNNVKGVNIPEVTQQARDADLQKYRDQFKELNAVDPATGQLRDASNAGLAANINDQNTQNSNQILQTLFNENVNVDPNDKAFSDSLKSEAAKQLALGGNFSPEQQAEFVRAGLETGAQGGFDAGSSATRQGVGKLLASESETLANNRRNMAQQLFGFATDLKTQRNNALQGIGQNSQGASAAQFSKLFNLANLADSRVPNIGLGGGDIANLAVGNTNTANNKTLQQGAVNANAAGAQGQILGGLVGSLSALPGQYLTYKALNPGTGGTLGKTGASALASGGRI